MRNAEELQSVGEERKIVQTTKRWKANWIGHICRRKCLLKLVVEGRIDGRIEVTGGGGKRSKLLLDNLKE